MIQYRAGKSNDENSQKILGWMKFQDRTLNFRWYFLKPKLSCWFSRKRRFMHRFSRYDPNNFDGWNCPPDFERPRYVKMPKSFQSCRKGWPTQSGITDASEITDASGITGAVSDDRRSQGWPTQSGITGPVMAHRSGSAFSLVSQWLMLMPDDNLVLAGRVQSFRIRPWKV